MLIYLSSFEWDVGLAGSHTLPPVFSVTNWRAGQQISTPPVAFVNISLLMRLVDMRDLLDAWDMFKLQQ
jgi:hypothetical protein